MSAMKPIQEQYPLDFPSLAETGFLRAAPKPQRVLACLLCQQRKVRCEKKFPCANCVKIGSQCVPTQLAPRQRRRRFSERELLERLRHYESLLRQNNIKFQPLHPAAAEKASPSDFDPPGDGHSEGTIEVTDQFSQTKTTTPSDPVNLWHAMNRTIRDPKDDDDHEDDDDDNESDLSHGDVHEGTIRKAWNHFRENNDLLLFGASKTNGDLSIFHPEPVQILKLWQVYQDNVNPLLKVTHTPTLQATIINVVSNMANISPTLEALMFSLYCVSILSLEDDACYTTFGSSKEELLNRFQFGCQQALLKCGFLRSDNRDCLTALYLYLISVKPNTDAPSLSAMLGIAVRIAQRMGIHNESNYIKCTVLEAEMRRRLWWSLMIFDTRICEMSNNLKASVLVPTWDCRAPVNINDFEIHPETKTLPAIHDQPTEALFAVVRSELGDFVRHSGFHLDITNPALKVLAKNTQSGSGSEGGELIALERMIEEKYLRACNVENSLHFMTLWTTRSLLAKNRLLDCYSKYPKSSVQQTDAQRNAATSYALIIIECDTKLLSSPLTKGYLWYIKSHFFFLAYIHIVQDLKKRPTQKYAEKAWEVMSEDSKFRFVDMELDGNPFFKIFSRVVLQAWEAREAALRDLNRPLDLPGIVLDIKRNVMLMASNFSDATMQQPDGGMSINIDDFLMPMPMGSGGQGSPFNAGPQAGSAPWGYADPPGPSPMTFDMNPLDLTTLALNPEQDRGW